MKVSVPVHPDSFIRRCFAAVQAGFERVKEYAVLPHAGAAGSVLVKIDARDYNTQWSGAPTTGTATASFAATNKPGAASGSPQLWIPVVVNGTTYYLPLFS